MKKWYALKLNKLFKICSFISIPMQMIIVQTTRLSHELCLSVELPQIEFYLLSDSLHHNLFFFQQSWRSFQTVQFNMVKTLCVTAHCSYGKNF